MLIDHVSQNTHFSCLRN